MVIKIGKYTITSITIFKVLFVAVLIATISLIILNVLSEKRIITEMVVFSTFITCICYYFSKDKEGKK